MGGTGRHIWNWEQRENKGSSQCSQGPPLGPTSYSPTPRGPSLPLQSSHTQAIASLHWHSTVIPTGDDGLFLRPANLNAELCLLPHRHTQK